MEKVAGDEKLESLTVFLCRADTETECIDADQGSIGYEMKLGDTKLGTLFVLEGADRVPGWYMAIRDLIVGASPPDVSAKRARAVWLLRAPEGQGFFALTFGDGRHLLKPGRIVAGFGLRCVLNLVDADSIRILRKRTLETVAAHSRLQAVENIPIDDFLIDIERDLLRGIVGVPTQRERFGSRIAGGDSLTVGASTRVPDIPELLQAVSAAYNGARYRERFDWVDNIQHIRDDRLIASLEKRTTEVLRGASKTSQERCFLALPDLSGSPDARIFRIRGSQNLVDDISLAALNHLGFRNIDLDFLRAKELLVQSDSDEIVGSWTLFDCLNVELEMDSKRYILADGEWFCVDPSFERTVKTATERIPLCARQFPSYADADEAGYSARIAGSDPYVACLDRKLISFGGGKSRFEFCDLFTSSNQLIHIKHYEGASPAMSHLFFQGLHSARLFKSDELFRRKVDNVLPELFKLSRPEAEIDSRNWEVVFAIISASPRPPAEVLPFFSLLSLHSVYRILHGELGYKVSMATIKKQAGIRILGQRKVGRLTRLLR